MALHLCSNTVTPQSALQWPRIHPFTHTFIHQWELLPRTALPPLGSVCCPKTQRQTRRGRDFNRQPFGAQVQMKNLFKIFWSIGKERFCMVWKCECCTISWFSTQSVMWTDWNVLLPWGPDSVSIVAGGITTIEKQVRFLVLWHVLILHLRFRSNEWVYTYL